MKTNEKLLNAIIDNLNYQINLYEEKILEKNNYISRLEEKLDKIQNVIDDI